jgi:polysaccharide export outer membrane protein
LLPGAARDSFRLRLELSRNGLMRWVTASLVLAVGLSILPPCLGQTRDLSPATATASSIADGNGIHLKQSPALTGVRRPLYRLRKSDVVEIRFTLSPEFDQTLTIQPDGYIALKNAGDLFAEGLSLSELRESVAAAYAAFLHDPEVSITLKDFEKPFFLAGGQVARPGKYELRSPTTVSEAVTIAGGFTEQAKHSQVVLFRKLLDGIVETHVFNVKSMLALRNLEEDVDLKPGDMLFVPQNRISKIRKYLPASSLSTFFTPAQF